MPASSRPRQVVVVVEDCVWWGCVVKGEGLVPPTEVYSSKKSAEGERVSVRVRKMRTTHEERDGDRASTPRASHGSFRSFFPFSTSVAFFSPPWSLPTEERDVLLLSLIPQRRVRIRFSRQIPCLQAAATFLFGINPFVLHPVSGTSTASFSLSLNYSLHR